METNDITLSAPEKRKYTKKLDEFGNPIPRKKRVRKLDENGNPIPRKQRATNPVRAIISDMAKMSARRTHLRERIEKKLATIEKYKLEISVLTENIKAAKAAFIRDSLRAIDGDAPDTGDDTGVEAEVKVTL